MILAAGNSARIISVLDCDSEHISLARRGATP
jgi:hypothetical protein